jgi:hypothetical protein
VSGRSSGPAGSAAAVACGAHARVTTPHLALRFHLPLLLQQELTKKQAAELCALFRRKLEGQRNTSTGGALPTSWPGLGGVSATGSQAPSPSVATPQFVPSAAPATPVWTGGGRAGSAAPEGHAEPAVPADLGGKTFAQIQEEEAKRAQKAAKAAAKQLAVAGSSSQSGGSSGRSSLNGSRPASAAGTSSAYALPVAGASGSSSSSSAVSAAAAANRAVLQQSAAAAAPAARPAYSLPSQHRLRRSSWQLQHLLLPLIKAQRLEWKRLEMSSLP